MSLEGSRERAREQARVLEEAIAQGAGVYLLGCPIVLLRREAARPVVPMNRDAANDSGPP